MIAAELLPTIFLGLIALSVLVYAILDGYDLGVGILLPLSDSQQLERDKMIASIGPFWDANETWLVLAVGLFLIAFPEAHNIILRELYLPATVMLIGLILRGVAFDFRAKVNSGLQLTWDRIFRLGSMITALTQGYMLGRYVMGFDAGIWPMLFAVLSALCVTAAYAFIGGSWLVMKTEGLLQNWSATVTRRALWLTALGIVAISVVNPIISLAVSERWFGMPQVILLFPIPIFCAAIIAVTDQYLARFPHHDDFGCWIPFSAAATVFFVCVSGLAYSYFPDVIPGIITADEAASASESLQFILFGALIVIPTIIAYTFYSYRVFWGKVGELRYF